MVTKKERRKLAAILAADMVDFSRLMEIDEVATLEALKSCRSKIIDPTISEHHGRIVNTTGDGVLVEFGSVVDAVASAVSIQRAIAGRNEAVPEDRRVLFRIGINLGDIIIDGDDIFGDGVNIAARLESIAEPGGICISGAAYEQLKAKVDVGYADLGALQVKNIATPVRVYRVLLDSEAAGTVVSEQLSKPRTKWAPIAGLAVTALVIGVLLLAWWPSSVKQVSTGSKDQISLALPDKPSIAVLPFVNLSGDPEQEYFADGLSGSLIAALSRVPELFVIARSSTFTYKGKTVTAQTVAEELGIRYVLEGSVQRGGQTVRVTAQLVDGTNGEQIWAKYFDRDLTDIFDIQDEITVSVTTALQVELTEGEYVRKWRAGTNNVEAWDHFLRANDAVRKFTKEDAAEARRLAQRAVELDPEFPGGWLLLAWTFWADASFGWGSDPQRSLETTTELVERGLSLDDALPELYVLYGQIYNTMGEHEKALDVGARGIALDPNNSINLAVVASLMNFAGKPEEGIGLIQKAMRRSPMQRSWYPTVLIQSYLLARRYDEFIRVAEEHVKQEVGVLTTRAHTQLAFVYTELGRHEEAQAHVATVIERDPGFSLTREKEQMLRRYKDSTFVEHYINTLTLAGLPE